MIGRYCKKFICGLFAVTAILLCPVVASADLGLAALIGGLSAVGVDVAATVGVTGAAAALLSWMSNEGFSVQGVVTGIADGYIKVGEDSVIIDGVQYDSIFLDPQFALSLHTQAFDFITQKAITDNSQGILATGAGFWRGIPIYNINNLNRSQTFVLSEGLSTVGDVTFNYYRNGSNRWDLTINYGNNLTDQLNYTGTPPKLLYFKSDDGGSSIRYRTTSVPGSGTYSTAYINSNASGVPSNPFEFDYVSGVIDVTPITSNTGFLTYIPNSVINNYGITAGTYTVDGGSGEDTILDILAAIDSAFEQGFLKGSEFVSEVVPPVPVPTTPLGEVPFDEWVDTFGQSVYSRLDQQTEYLDIIGGAGEDAVQAIDTYGQSIVEELENTQTVVDTAGQSIVDGLADVETAVDTVGQSVDTLTDTVEAVGEGVDSIAESMTDVIEAVQTHPLDLFDAFLDGFTSIPFVRDLFDSFKRHVGIWHYVVEWLSCIKQVFLFFFGIMSDVAYCLVVPVYALIAGSICLALYKRFGR